MNLYLMMRKKHRLSKLMPIEERFHGTEAKRRHRFPVAMTSARTNASAAAKPVFPAAFGSLLVAAKSTSSSVNT
jgi:hypothetical protein